MSSGFLLGLGTAKVVPSPSGFLGYIREGESTSITIVLSMFSAITTVTPTITGPETNPTTAVASPTGNSIQVSLTINPELHTGQPEDNGSGYDIGFTGKKMMTVTLTFNVSGMNTSVPPVPLTAPASYTFIKVCDYSANTDNWVQKIKSKG